MTIEETLGYTFFDPATLTRALTRKAHANEERQHGANCEDQDVLATLGDAVLKTILVDHLIRSGCTTPDEVTQAKKELEREELLASVAREIGIGPFLFLRKGRGEAERQGPAICPRREPRSDYRCGLPGWRV